MTTGWDATRRVNLNPPWESFYLDVYEDPPAGDWINLIEAVRDIPTGEAGISRACDALNTLIAAHNLTNRAGEPIEIKYGTTNANLLLAIIQAFRGEADEPAPLVQTSSPATSSRARPNRSTLPSTRSPGKRARPTPSSSVHPAAS